MVHATYFITLSYNHQVLNTEDVQNPKETLDLKYLVCIVPHNHIYMNVKFEGYLVP